MDEDNKGLARPEGPGSRPTDQAPSGFDPSRIWSEHLTDHQLLMVMESAEDAPDAARGYGVELSGGKWATARSLVRKGLGYIDGDPRGSLPGLYFNNEEGVRVSHEFDDEEEEECWGCPLCGHHEEHSHAM